MENNTELVRLEGFVDKLLMKYNQLKKDFHALQETLSERDSECAELKATISDLRSERTEVGSRVTNLLDRIEQWESEHVSETGDSAGAQNSEHGALYMGEAGSENS